MVEAARRRSLPGVEHRVMDMQASSTSRTPASTRSSAASATCSSPIPSGHSRETRRVLRPGGRLAFATWAPAKRNPWATAYGPVLIERGLQEPPKPDEPGQFALSSAEEIEPLVRGAGFDAVAVQEVPIEYRFESWSDYRRVVTGLAASLRQLLAGLDDDTRAEVDAAARRRLEPFRSGEGYVLPGVALVTSAS